MPKYNVTLLLPLELSPLQMPVLITFTSILSVLFLPLKDVVICSTALIVSPVGQKPYQSPTSLLKLLLALFLLIGYLPLVLHPLLQLTAVPNLNHPSSQPLQTSRNETDTHNCIPPMYQWNGGAFPPSSESLSQGLPRLLQVDRTSPSHPSQSLYHSQARSTMHSCPACLWNVSSFTRAVLYSLSCHHAPSTLHSMQIVYHPICTSFGQFRYACNLHHHMYHPIFLHALTFVFATMPSANLSIHLTMGLTRLFVAMKHFILDIHGKHISVTLDCLKNARLDTAPVNNASATHKVSPTVDAPQSKDFPRTTCSGRRVHFPDRYGTACLTL